MKARKDLSYISEQHAASYAFALDKGLEGIKEFWQLVEIGHITVKDNVITVYKIDGVRNIKIDITIE